MEIKQEDLNALNDLEIEIPMDMEMEPTIVFNNELEYEHMPRSQTVAMVRSIKLMSDLLKRQKTPKNIRGVEIDDSQRQKYSKVKSKILAMNIEIEEPTYD